MELTACSKLLTVKISIVIFNSTFGMDFLILFQINLFILLTESYRTLFTYDLYLPLGRISTCH